MTAQAMLPNLIIIGAMKSGTSSLHYYLDQHPQIAMSTPKELDFFIKEINWDRGIDWYKSHFSSNTKILGETSPNYSAFPQFRDVPERMHSLIPNAKLIYLVRDPIERMLSHYVHSVYMGRERRSPDEALADPDSLYINRSKYYKQLDQYIQYYDKSNILVVSSEDLLRNRQGCLKSIFVFLGVDDNYVSSSFEEIRHLSSSRKRRTTRVGGAILRAARSLRPLVPHRLRVSLDPLKKEITTRQIEKPRVAESTLREIRSQLRSDTEGLRRYTGRQFAEWSV